MEDDKDKEGEATQKLRKKLKDFMVPIKAAKAFLKQQESYKRKKKAKALLCDFGKMGTKRTFKSTELINSNSNKEEEKRVCVIKKIKCEHIEELTGTRKRKEIIKLKDEEVKIVASKTPAAGPLHLTSKPVVLVPSALKSILKLIVVLLASPVAGPSTTLIVPSSASKPAITAALSKPAPVKFAGPAIKGDFIFKDPFIVRQLKLADTEESGVLIINQATEVALTQETLDKNKDKDNNDDENGKNNNDNSDDDDAAMNIDSAKRPEETWPMAPTKAAVTEVEALVLVPLIKLN
ncbi:hypothetical protein C0995_013822 [Termitomyces sp. Mi166|nr:hypothetical protein C0995_013822 [Termitomyces sp. Mi166\